MATTGSDAVVADQLDLSRSACVHGLLFDAGFEWPGVIEVPASVSFC